MKNKKGFIALTTVLVLSAVFLSISIGVASRAISGATMSSSLYASNKAEILADGCAEYALLKLRRSLEYAGNESIEIDGTQCEILDIGGTGNTNRSIDVQSTVQGHVHRIRVLVEEISPTMKIASYEFVTSF